METVLGTRAYCLYSKQTATICQRHQLHYHYYAGDTQVYVGVTPNETCVDASSKLEACSVDISAWVSGIIFMLNQQKTELIIVKPKRQLKVSYKTRLRFGEKTVVRVERIVKNLSVYLDTAPTTEGQFMWNIFTARYSAIPNIGRCLYVTRDACKTLTPDASVTSGLDNSNVCGKYRILRSAW